MRSNKSLAHIHSGFNFSLRVVIKPADYVHTLLFMRELHIAPDVSEITKETTNKFFVLKYFQLLRIIPIDRKS
jgi:hypothetical protein